MPGKRVTRVSVFRGLGGPVCISTALAKNGLSPLGSKPVHLTSKQLNHLAGRLNKLVMDGRGTMYAHSACGFVWRA